MTSNLSWNDVVMPKCYTRILVVFDYKINDLGESLLEFLDQFCPDAFGEIVYDNDKPNFGQIIQSGAFREKIFTAAEQADVSVSHYINGSFQDFDVFPYPAIPTDDSPLFFLHQIHLKDGTVLAVGLHHHIADGHGFFSLIDRFSQWLRDPDRSKIEPLIHDRTLLKASDEIRYEHLEYTIKPPSFSFTALPQMEVIVKRWRKETIFNYLNIKNRNLSFNDVLVAWLTKTISQIRQIPTDQTVNVLMAGNGREALGVGPNYFGNCNFYMSFQYSMSDIIEQCVDELAEKINSEKKIKLSKDYITSAMAWVKAAETQVYPGAQSFCGKDMAFTNWSRFPVYQIDFGQGPPKRMTLPAARYDGLVLILPTATDELELYIGLIKEHADEFLKQIPE